MPRLRKLRRKQKYQYHVNRRRLNDQMTKLPDIKCEAVKKAWDNKKSLRDNLSSMGLVADPNNHKGFKILSGKELLKKNARALDSEEDMLSQEGEEHEVGEKQHVADELEKQAKDGYEAKKAVAHPLPPEMSKKLTKFLDKYGEDFEAMARDHTNYYQETASQLRAQVNRLKGIPQQWIPYLKSRDLLENHTAPLESK